jgi:hypothetical protein
VSFNGTVVTVAPSALSAVVTCTVSVTDSANDTPASIAITAYPPIAFTPTTIALANPGDSKNDTVSGGSGSGYNVTSNGACNTTAPTPTMAISGGTQGGMCSIVVADSVGDVGTLAVTIGSYGGIVASKTSMTFTNVNGNTTPANNTSTISGGSGGYTVASNNCPTAAHATFAGTTLTVAPNALSSIVTCTVTITDSASDTPASIAITAYPAMTFTPSSIALANPNDTKLDTVGGGSGSGYTLISNGACTSPISGTTITVSGGTQGGTCSVVVDDNVGDRGTLPVTVGSFSGITATSTALTFTNVNGNTSPTSAASTVSGGTGTGYTVANNNCPAAAGATFASPTLTVTPNGVSSIINCTIRITDSASDTAVPIAVTAYPPIAFSLSPLELNGGFLQFESLSGGSGTYNDPVLTSGACTVSGLVAGNTFGVSDAIDPDTCMITETDSATNVGTLVVNVDNGAVVRATSIKLSSTSLLLTTTRPSATTISVSEAGYTGAFAVKLSGSAATVVMSPATKGKATLIVAPKAAGNAVVVVSDTKGHTAKLAVTVVAHLLGSPVVIPSPKPSAGLRPVSAPRISPRPIIAPAVAPSPAPSLTAPKQKPSAAPTPKASVSPKPTPSPSPSPSPPPHPVPKLLGH